MSSPPGTRLHFEGVLDKAGKRFFEGFRKRWFILDGQYLSYYKASERTEENYLGTIDFSQVNAVNPLKTSNEFQVVTRSRTYTFCAQTPEKLTEWLSVLRQAMQLKTFPGSQKKYLSSQDSIDSQYEVVVDRHSRSYSFPSDDLYSVVKDSHRKSAAPDEEYSVVGAANTFPRRSTSAGNEEGGRYELPGSRPPSKSDPPTYDMVQAAKHPSAGTAPCDSVAGGNENLAFYDLVRAEQPAQEQKSDSSPSPEDVAARMVHQPADDVANLYSLPDVSKRSKADKPSMRSLSIIAENEEAEAPSPLQTPEETPPPIPPRVEEEPFAIHEIKRILNEENERNETFSKGDEDEDELPVDESVSAFQQLKEFLQRLDSNEEH